MDASHLLLTGLFALAMIRLDTAEAAARPSREAFEPPLLPTDLRQADTYMGGYGLQGRRGVQHPASSVLWRPGGSTDSRPRGRRGRRLHAKNTSPRPAPPASDAQKMAMCPKPVRVTSLGTVGEPQGWFVFHIHVHDDVPSHRARDVAQRFDWWLREMRDLLPQGTGLELRIVRNEKGLSDIEYTSGKDEDSEKGLKALKAALARQRPCDTGLPMTRHYHPLLTANQPFPGMRGLASPGARGGIASMSSARTAGHELGHMLYATHEQGAGERIDGSQRCVTAMREDRGWMRYPDCDRFSKANRETIRRGLAGIWTKAQAARSPTKA